MLLAGSFANLWVVRELAHFAVRACLVIPNIVTCVLGLEFKQLGRMTVGTAIALRALPRLAQRGTNDLTFVGGSSSFCSALGALLRLVTLRVTERAIVPLVAFGIGVLTEEVPAR